MRAPTTPSHGGSAPSPAKITSLVACHLGLAVRLGHPRDRSQAATEPIRDSRAKMLSAQAPRRPFGLARLHGRTPDLLNQPVLKPAVHAYTCADAARAGPALQPKWTPAAPGGGMAQPPAGGPGTNPTARTGPRAHQLWPVSF